MANKKRIYRIFICISLFFGITFNEANSAVLSASCTKYGTSRSSVSVVATGLNGYYYIVIISGALAYRSPAKWVKAGALTVYNFDSNITAVPGATYISPAFIKNLRVDNYMRQSGTARMDANLIAFCKAK